MSDVLRSPFAESAVPALPLPGGGWIPQIGFGVFQIPAALTQEAVEAALEVGYRHLDTAAAYNNERAVGAAVRASGLPREQVFVTTKLRNGEQGFESARRALSASLDRLGLDHVDLYLLHWPSPGRNRYIESWQSLEKAYEAGEAAAIGLSNFLPHHLDALMPHVTVRPAVNQLEIHPSFQQREVTRRAADEGMLIEAYSPLGRGTDLRAPAVVEAADRHGTSPAAVILQWHLEAGRVVIPKTTSRERMRENVRAFELSLTRSELEQITATPPGERTGNDPDLFELSQIRLED